MNWGIVCVLLFSLATGYIWWPSKERSASTVLAVSLIMGSILTACIYIPQFWPLKREVVEHRTIIRHYKDPPKVVFKDRLVYRLPDGEVAPVDVTRACKGGMPIQIVKMNVADGDKESRTTWITGHLVGSKVLFTCGQPGDYSDSWKVDDIVQFVRGEPQ